MISGIRDNALALACAHRHLPTIHGRGIDQLPSAVAGLFDGSLIRELDRAELSRAFGAALDGLLTVMREADPELAERLREALLYLKEIPK